jgi:hypothetical protein
MASKVQFFSIEEALIGTYYSSSVRRYNSGIIVHAEAKPYSNGEYIVRVRPEYAGGILNEFWATIAVG